MNGSLALAHGVLWVGSHAMTAHVRPFDLDGRPLGPGFRFRDPEAPRSAAAGLAVDDDHRVWVADTPAGVVRAFSVVGREVLRLGGGEGGLLERPVDLDLAGEPGEDPLLVVGCGGRRRHGVLVLEPGGSRVASLRPLGDPQGVFEGVAGVAALARHLYACEPAAGRVQVFRDQDFHFALATGPGRRPAAAAPLRDGRVAVACGGARSGILLFDGGGRRLRELVPGGPGEGAVEEPEGLAVDDADSDRASRLFVLDRDGERVQVYNLAGTCFGAFEGLAG